jgi:nucleolar protein 4
MGEKTGQLKRRREHVGDPSFQKSQKTEVADQSGDRVQTEPAPKRARVDAHRSLFVRSLPPSATDETLTDFFSQHYPGMQVI